MARVVLNWRAKTADVCADFLIRRTRQRRAPQSTVILPPRGRGVMMSKTANPILCNEKNKD